MNFINTTNIKQFSQASSQSQQVIKNKGFLLLHEEFTKNGWYLVENEFNHIVYEKEARKCSQFTIDIFDSHIKVNVPIGNTDYSYSTKFAEYFRAQEFLLMHLNAMEESIKELRNKQNSLNDNDNDNSNYEEDTQE